MHEALMDLNDLYFTSTINNGVHMKKVLGLVMALGLLVGACGAESMDEYDEALDDGEIVAETEQELGEAGCATVAVDAVIDLPPPGCGGYRTVTSPNASYDHGSTCPGQYVVDMQELGPEQLATWGDTLPSTKSACEKIHVEKAYYTQFSYYFNGVLYKSWSLNGVAKYTGHWIDILSFCGMELDPGYSEPQFDQGLFNHQWRMAARAYTLNCGPSGCTETPKKVKVGTFKPPC
jgi:hypothetical protein